MLTQYSPANGITKEAKNEAYEVIEQGIKTMVDRFTPIEILGILNDIKLGVQKHYEARIADAEQNLAQVKELAKPLFQ